eukprot:TRINITY_DN41880_c0_g1_i1.p1 TRINITY_DN41880_c0_g1~~TRINITY_DN41880_c0_g1_i1.p1  ORF type:complete len:674 (+),score=107.77 TRINITY_DN41880_c0_g1_i1:77-2023(+)
MIPRTICTRQHPLEPKVVTGGFFAGLSNFSLKKCSECRQVLKIDTTRFTCKPCGFHLCGHCRNSVACPRGHHLQRQYMPGGFLGLSLFATKKNCYRCAKELSQGDVENCCKLCDFHMCDACTRALLDSYKPDTHGVMVAAMPSTGSLPMGPAKSEPAPSTASSPPTATCPDDRRRACKYGTNCFRKNPEHLDKFAHPGDRNYRNGLVIFDGDLEPEFLCLLHLFQYFDVEESGHLSKSEFLEAFEAVMRLLRCAGSDVCERYGLSDESPAPSMEHLELAWEDAGGLGHGYVNFRSFVTWTQEHLSLEYPLGLEAESEAPRPCRFRLMSSHGHRCSCPGFTPADTAGLLCVCGHKVSMHRSDIAESSLKSIMADTANAHWVPEKEGLVEIEEPALLSQLQDMLIACHKQSDNWTRDRGCSVHGVNGCAASCASKNRKAVPGGYIVKKAFRNQNVDLWQKYCLSKRAIAEECARAAAGTSSVEMNKLPVATSKVPVGDLNVGYNEWHLFHGTSPEGCQAICSMNFKVALAGSGATWKDGGKDKGTPLYGFGIYFAEHITKADEYTKAIPGEDGGEYHTVLLCRVMGGCSNLVTTNEIEIDKLKRDVFDGPYHSVFGDRIATLKKPFREVVVYDRDQVYPEYLLLYQRIYE